MPRRPKTDRVPRTRAGGEWTEASFWGFIRSLLRQGSKRWPPRREAMNEARVPYVGPNKRQKWLYVCAKCGWAAKATEVQIDHIIPCGTLKSYDDLPGFVERLFCEVEGFQVLCKPCHQEITNEERNR